MSLHIARKKNNDSNGTNLLRFDQSPPGEPFTKWFSSTKTINGYYPTKGFDPAFKDLCIATSRAICNKLKDMYGDNLDGWEIAVVDDANTILWDSLQEFGDQGVVIFLPLRPKRKVN